MGMYWFRCMLLDNEIKVLVYVVQIVSVEYFESSLSIVKLGVNTFWALQLFLSISLEIQLI